MKGIHIIFFFFHLNPLITASFLIEFQKFWCANFEIVVADCGMILVYYDFELRRYKKFISWSLQTDLIPWYDEIGFMTANVDLILFGYA